MSIFNSADVVELNSLKSKKIREQHRVSIHKIKGLELKNEELFHEIKELKGQNKVQNHQIEELLHANKMLTERVANSEKKQNWFNLINSYYHLHQKSTYFPLWYFIKG